VALRIASLLPSATEIVCALGARDALVGVSHECDFPPGVEALPRLTRARCAPPSASSLAIDRSVRDVVATALGVYEIDTGLLADVAPDVVVTQDLCDVCAVPLGEVRDALARLARRDVTIVSLHPTRLGDILADVETTARAIARAPEGAALRAAVAARVEAVRRRVDGAPPPAVVTIEWLEPLMLGGTWMPDLVEAAGGRPLGPGGGERAPTLDREAAARLAPHVVVVAPCGFTLARTRTELALLPRVLPWDTWPAVRADRVFAVDGNAYLNRPGPRIADSLEILAACLHPARCADLAARHREAFVRVAPDLSLHPPV
jgi:iron complex transport system substrate-binding protein